MTSTLSRRGAAARPETARRRPSGRLHLAAIAAVVVVVAAVWVVAFSPLFGVRSVEVHGTSTLTTQQVTDAADLANGTPLVRVDTDAVALRVEALPTVASATVETSFPSTVDISVVERVAVGSLARGGKYVLVDATGVQYRTVSHRPARLPLFDLPEGADAVPSGRAVAHVAGALPAPLLAKVDSVDALDPDMITIDLADGRTVAWGSAADTAAKVRLLPVLLKQDGDVFDVSDPSHPFTR